VVEDILYDADGDDVLKEPGRVAVREPVRETVGPVGGPTPRQ
jgi:hypothetical protein